MGNCCVKGSPNDYKSSVVQSPTEIDKKETQNNNRINKDLVASYEEDKKLVKVLLLGSGESGKSTFIKQMKILHQKGFTNEEKQQFYRAVIYDNLFEITKALASACVQSEIKFDSEDNKRMADELIKIAPSYDILRDDRIVHLIKVLSTDNGIIRAMQRAVEFQIQLPDSAHYFFSSIERLLKSDYSPTDDDILRSRVATTGVIQTKFFYRNTNFMMFDVGGQKCERKKWIHCFDNVTAIVFVASLSEYDHSMREDKKRNRLEDSLALFEAIVNLPWFKDTSIILFFNKEDVFRDKIRTVDLGMFCPGYTGGCNYENALKYIQEEYLRRVYNKNKKVYVHVTCATNTKNIVYVWKDVTKILIHNRLMQLGLIRPQEGDKIDYFPSSENEPDPLDQFLNSNTV